MVLILSLLVKPSINSHSTAFDFFLPFTFSSQMYLSVFIMCSVPSVTPIHIIYLTCIKFPIFILPLTSSHNTCYSCYLSAKSHKRLCSTPQPSPMPSLILHSPPFSFTPPPLPFLLLYSPPFSSTPLLSHPLPTRLSNLIRKAGPPATKVRRVKMRRVVCVVITRVPLCPTLT